LLWQVVKIEVAELGPLDADPRGVLAGQHPQHQCQLRGVRVKPIQCFPEYGGGVPDRETRA
jgi:hypothetical protein